MAAGDSHACAVLADRTVKCWGQGRVGQLSDDQLADSNSPVAVNGIAGAVTVTAGATHSCALLADSTVRCWGQRAYGLLGNNFGPAGGAVTGITTAVQIAAGSYNTCAVLSDGQVRCWGQRITETRSNEANWTSVPVQVGGISGATSVALGFGHACAVIDGASIYCWGVNSDGQLGNGTTTSSTSPGPVIGL